MIQLIKNFIYFKILYNYENDEKAKELKECMGKFY